jgi:hypothetical protein
MLRVMLVVSLATALPSARLLAQSAGSSPSLAVHEVTLRLQELAPIRHDVSARFVGYVDNRCPTDLACLVPGHTSVLLHVLAPPMPSRLVALQWPIAESESQLDNTAFGFRFCFVSLEPHPHSRTAPDPASYRVRFKFGTERALTECKSGA